MMWIGLAGGVGCGKSRVAAFLETLGAYRLDADRVAAEVLETPRVRAGLRRRFGADVVPRGEAVRRAELARRVFADPMALADLNRLVHPGVRRRLLRGYRAPPVGKKWGVLDIPLLFESGWDERCNVVLFLDAPAETRCARARARGWSRREWQRREASQMPIAEKRRRAQFVVDTGASWARTRRALVRLAGERC